MATSPVVDSLRWGLGSALRRAIAGDLHLEASEVATADDPGLFGPGSPVWQVHGDTSMLIGGLRALLLQTLHPLAMAGVAHHSDYRHDPWGRLHRTGHFIGATTFGNTATAERAIEIVRRVHRPIRGTAPDGRPYSADDPHLMLWVHLTEVDSFLRAHRRYGDAPLRPDEADAYVAQMARIARRLGTEEPPTDVASLRAALHAFLPELAATAQARDAVWFLLLPPVPLVARGVYGLIAGAAIGLLPPWARRQLWLPVPPLVDPLLIRPAAQGLTRTMGWLLASQPSPGRRARRQTG